MPEPHSKRVQLPDKKMLISIDTNYNPRQVGYTSRVVVVCKDKNLTDDQVASVIGSIMEVFDTGNHVGGGV